jgi:hypothetical protein
MSNSGAAVCRITATYSGGDPCPTEVGWLDPMGADGVRAPSIAQDGASDTRTCEIQQLDGAALASCQSTLDCSDCIPGWCATQVPDLRSSKYCGSGQFPWPFRFVQGADAGPESASDLAITIVCDEAHVQ